MTAAVCFFFVLLLCYSGILLWLVYGYLRTPHLTVVQKRNQTAVTIIICARNEEKTISHCLSSLLKQDYAPGNIQLILINDASTDSTVLKAESILKTSGINYRIITNAEQKGKKASITYAMQQATHELIVLRDADTFTHSGKWLQSVSDCYAESSADLIIAPVAIADSFGLFWALQAIENNVLAVAACGSTWYNKSFLCSGANLIFTKAVFEKTNGYTSHSHIASGDDIFFLEDVKKLRGSKILYLKSWEAIVYTYPCFSFSDLIRQKTRWASKFKLNKNKLNLALSLLAFSVNFAWLFCFVFVNDPVYREALLLFVLFKLFIDILLLFLASGFIKNKNILWFALPVGFIYPIYACVVGIASVFVKPRWK